MLDLGGVPETGQVQSLKKATHFVVATPGRLLSLVRKGLCPLSRVTYLVLDEADRMLDLGFEPDIREIISHVTTERQTCLFSATWPRAIQVYYSVTVTRLSISLIVLCDVTGVGCGVRAESVPRDDRHARRADGESPRRAAR